MFGGIQDQLQAIAGDYNNFCSLPGIGDYIDGRLREFDEVLKFKIRQFDVGFFDPQEPEVPQCLTRSILDL